MVEDASLQPYIIVVKQLMADSEMGHFKDTAVKELSRSGHAGKTGETTSMRRTSKQAWLDHRNFNYSISDLSVILGTSEAETNKTLRENNNWASVMVRPDTLISSDKVLKRVIISMIFIILVILIIVIMVVIFITIKVLERVSNRMERVTRTTLLSPIGAEQFQVAIPI